MSEKETPSPKGKDADKGKKDRNELSINYLALRKYIGILGILLPVIMLVGSCVVNDGILENAISEYFHTSLRQFFTIILGGMGLLLFAYRGYDNWDRWVTNIAGFFGLLTAFIPTSMDEGAKLKGYVLMQGKRVIPLDSLPRGPYEIMPEPTSDLQPTLHTVCAALFFISLAYMAGVQFTKAGGEREIRLYKSCAWVIVGGIGMMALSMIPSLEDLFDRHNLLFWGETICLWAFGTTWIAKGVYTEAREKKRDARKETDEKLPVGSSSGS